MRADGELLGPVGYPAWWWALAVGLLVLVVAWNAGLLLWGRRRSRPAHESRPVDARALAARYLRLLDEVAADHAAGRLDARAGHQRVSALVREFLEQVSGVAATTMTLADLRALGADAPAGVVGVVEAAYPPSFGPDAECPAGDLEETLARARRVVDPWT